MFGGRTVGRFNFTGLLDELARQELVLGLVLIGAGLVFMLMGTQMSRVLVAISFGVIGFVVAGFAAGADGDDMTWLIYAFAAAILLGAVSMYFERPAVGVLAGAWAALCVMGYLANMRIPEQVWYALGVVTFGAVIAMSVILYEETVAGVTSFEGAILTLSGCVIFLSEHPAFWRPIRDLLINTPIFAPFLVLAVTVTGFYLQLAKLRQKQSGMSG